MPPRVAVFENGFAPDGAMRQFSADDVALLRDYVPAALVIPLQLALTLADRKLRGLLDMPALTTAVLVLTRVGDEALEEHHRDLLWRAFGVPVFEQLRNRNGLVIARECEVHDGLHVDLLTASDDFGRDLEIIRAHCECGAETPRLRRVKPVAARVMMAAAS